ncbi:INCENP-ARK-bind domain-containing protein [Favolaschia claudopus]|uniref:INCENP-ARK-bind domain-containing protein n=1 Tax=Favolaschia claudopus TaxID=2862362 RepID=A0AAW0EH15_9AGAR
MEGQGLLEWCNSTRFTMVNDPGRQLFHDQIQTHGFLFLTDYLDNILAGPRRDPLIELVKTPGRKRTTNRKPLAHTSNLRTVAVSLEDDSDAGAKENVAPVNSFHLALLQAKAKSPPPKPPSIADHHGPAAPLGDHGNQSEDSPARTSIHVAYETPLPSKEMTPEPQQSQLDKLTHSLKDSLNEPTPTIISPRSPSVAVISDDWKAPVEEPRSLAPMPVEQGDLSVIAEDDEMDRTRGSLQGRSDSPHASVDQIVVAAPMQETLTTVPEPVQDVHYAASQPASPISPLPFSRQQSPPAASSHKEAMSDIRSAITENRTEPLPQISTWHSREPHIDMTAPLPAATDETIKVEDPVAHKATVPSLPSLPAPVPFRKSIRVPSDPSTAAGPLGAATPGGALGGKRTSWLMRAREVKALEITVKKPNATASSLPGAPTGSKRKSGDMFGVAGLEDEERKAKVAKTTEGEVAPSKPPTPDTAATKSEPEAEQPGVEPPEQQGLLLQLKKTVDGLGSRFGKSMGKSLGGAAAVNALAEARAAAEARLVERHKEEEATMALGAPTQKSTATEPAQVLHSSHSRLSVSELVVSSPVNRGIDKEASNSPAGTSAPSHDEPSNTVRTEQPTRPVFLAPPAAPAPVFNKPQPVFVPPSFAPLETAPAPSQPSTFKMPISTAFSKPAPMALGLAPRLPSPKQTAPAPLSAQSTMESIRSDRLFDSQDSQDDHPAWMPSTQDTEYTSGFGSQSQCSPDGGMAELEDDDSWPLAERVGGGWFALNTVKEDTSMTWSSQPTESQRLDTGPISGDDTTGFIPQDQPPLPALQSSNAPFDASHSPHREFTQHQPIPGSFHMDIDDDEYDDDLEPASNHSVLGEMDIDPSKSTVSLVEPRSQSQMSQVSTMSSTSSLAQSQGGFLGQASKLVNSVLGTGKKAKPEVKSLQLAAIAAKKQQEEKEKKASMLKNMEARRQAHLQRKAEEEKAKLQEEERKLKEERERLKKEREEYTDKRPLMAKSAGTKKEEEVTKKRKILAEAEKKPELKKPMLKQPALNSSMSSKLPSKAHLTKLPQSTLASSTTFNTASSSKLTESNLAKSQAKGKPPIKNMLPEDDISQPSQFLQNQMAARAKAQMQAANPALPPSESIELPDINSEYSDSDDEDRPRTFDPPSWAQDPVLKQALEIQSTINPDDIFGAVRPLKMEEVFRNKTGRFRARTSSANWTGTDRLTVEEQREYVKRMGFR